MTLRFLPAGDQALLVELADLDTVLSLFASLTADPPQGVLELVPAARTLAVTYDRHRITATALAQQIARRDLSVRPGTKGREIEIPVTYDGQDLAEVARLTGLTEMEVIARHTGTLWQAAFNGFAPGFCYLTGGDPALAVPRRESPRSAIPAGSVALAGPFSGVYPQQSPGGWQIIGTTHMPMWDLGRSPPALIAPGDRVRFVDRPGHRGATPAKAASLTPAAPPARLDVIAAPLPVLFQDGGRPGQLSQGIAASGAADKGAFRALNRLLGNPASAAALELGAGPLTLCATASCTLALTGGDRRITLNGNTEVAAGQPFAVDPGDEIAFGGPRSGCYSYLGVRGGFAITPVLGSSATDTLAHIGPEPVRAGGWIGLASRPAQPIGPADPAADLPQTGSVVVIDVVPGPRTDRFSANTFARFLAGEWLVTPQSSRIGKRLEGPDRLLRDDQHELPSEVTMTGAIQIPHAGQPVLFLADHPLTGGYPVIATVAAHHLDLAAQIPPGAKIRFRALAHFSPITPEVSR